MTLEGSPIGGSTCMQVLSLGSSIPHLKIRFHNLDRGYRATFHAKVHCNPLWHARFQGSDGKDLQSAMDAILRADPSFWDGIATSDRTHSCHLHLSQIVE